MEETLGPFWLTRRLGIPSFTVAEALVPYLETPDAAVAGEIREWLKGLECGKGRDAPEYLFWLYKPIIHRALARGDDPPHALLRYLFDRQPGAALLLMLRETMEHAPVPGGQERAAGEQMRTSILWSDHVIWDTIWKHEYGFLDKDKVEPEAARELERLARHKEWWVRLYAAEIMRQHPAFRREVLVRRLAKDKHPLVREVAEKIQAQKDGNEGDKQDDGG